MKGLVRLYLTLCQNPNIIHTFSPYQQEGLKNSEADALHSKLEQMKQATTVYNPNTTCSNGIIVEDIIKTSDKNYSSLYLQCKTLQNHLQS